MKSACFMLLMMFLQLHIPPCHSVGSSPLHKVNSANMNGGLPPRRSLGGDQSIGALFESPNKSGRFKKFFTRKNKGGSKLTVRDVVCGIEYYVYSIHTMYIHFVWTHSCIICTHNQYSLTCYGYLDNFPNSFTMTSQSHYTV